jgi:DNA-binding MarR family transcriptional regulator
MLDSTEPAYRLENSLGYLTRRVSQAIGKRLLENFQQAGLAVSIDQWLLLVYIYHHDGQNQQCIGEFCAKDRASITRLIDQLEREQYLERKADTNDRRNNLIFITPKGCDLTRQLMRLADQTLEESTAHIDPAQLALCRQTLLAVLANLDCDLQTS